MLTADSAALRVAVVGGGPGGLYFSLLMKKVNAQHRVTVFERNVPDSTFGWGVVFSDQTLENFKAADAVSYQQIIDNFAHWDDIDVHFKGTCITSGGHGFSGIARKKLLQILQERAREVGVDLRFQTEVADLAALKKLGLADADLIVAADGINSSIRRQHANKFQPDLDVRSAKFVWLGTDYKFDAFTFYFVQNEL